MPEIGVVVETELGIHTQNVTTFDLSERVDLDLCRVLLLEELVKLDEDIGSLLLCVGLEFELLGDLESLVLRETGFEVNRGRDDGRRVVTGNILDAGMTKSRSGQFTMSKLPERLDETLTSYHLDGKRQERVLRDLDR